MAAVLLYFRAGPAADRARVAALAARPAQRARARRAARLVHRARHDPDRDLRRAVQGPDRDRRARPLPDRHRADRARPGAARWPSRSGTRERAIEQIDDARRLRDRLRAGARADPGRVALGRDDHRRAVPRASTARPRRASRSCCRSRPWCSAACSSSARSSSGEEGQHVGAVELVVATRARVRGRLRLDRVPAALSSSATRRSSSWSTGSCSARSCSCWSSAGAIK